MAIAKKYRVIVRNGVASATAAGPLGAVTGPFDAAAIGSIWTTMLVAIGDRSGHSIDGTFVTKFISTVGSGAVAYYGGCKAATWLFHLIPGAGTLAAMGVSSALNAVFIYKFGAATSKLLNKNSFDLTDAADAASSVLLSMCTFPSFGEVKDLLDLMG